MVLVTAHLQLSGLLVFPVMDDWLLVADSKSKLEKDIEVMLNLLPGPGVSDQSQEVSSNTSKMGWVYWGDPWLHLLPSISATWQSSDSHSPSTGLAGIPHILGTIYTKTTGPYGHSDGGTALCTDAYAPPTVVIHETFQSHTPSTIQTPHGTTGYHQLSRLVDPSTSSIARCAVPCTQTSNGWQLRLPTGDEVCIRDGVHVGNQWDPHQWTAHISYLELLAVSFAFWSFRNFVQNHSSYRWHNHCGLHQQTREHGVEC